MDHLPPVPDARARLELGAIKGLLQAQRRRIRSYTRDHRPDLEAAPDAPSPAHRHTSGLGPSSDNRLREACGNVDAHCASSAASRR